jgi:hypothetical protein
MIVISPFDKEKCRYERSKIDWSKLPKKEKNKEIRKYFGVQK